MFNFTQEHKALAKTNFFRILEIIQKLKSEYLFKKNSWLLVGRTSCMAC